MEKIHAQIRIHRKRSARRETNNALKKKTQRGGAAKLMDTIQYLTYYPTVHSVSTNVVVITMSTLSVYTPLLPFHRVFSATTNR